VIITTQKLIDLAGEEVRRRAAGGDLVAAYLVGSVAAGDPLLGGTADIDVVLIHRQAPSAVREFLSLSREIHLDLAHHAMERYSQPRRLRHDPWLGPAVREARLLHDPEHFFDWAQAGARGQFERPGAVSARAEALLAEARRHTQVAAHDAAWRGSYLRALLHACNAAAVLVGAPACGRRISTILKRRFVSLGDPSLFDAYRALHGAGALTAQDVAEAISVWARLAEVAPDASQPGLSPARAAYWLGGFRALAESGSPDAVVWPLFFTWETVLRSNGGGIDPQIASAFADVLKRAALDDAQRASRLLALEAFCDRVEELLQAWASRQGG
jgi:predicted nucleotidyltransferase